MVLIIRDQIISSLWVFHPQANDILLKHSLHPQCRYDRKTNTSRLFRGCDLHDHMVRGIYSTLLGVGVLMIKFIVLTFIISRGIAIAKILKPPKIEKKLLGLFAEK